MTMTTWNITMTLPQIETQILLYLVAIKRIVEKDGDGHFKEMYIMTYIVNKH